MKKAGKYFIHVFLGILLLYCAGTPAQQPVAKIPPPSGEVFAPADGLISFKRPRTLAELSDNDHFTFYENDGSIWYEVYWPENKPDYFESIIADFKPIMKSTSRFSPLLRLKGVSENWYEVVVNEKTNKTKFLRISNTTEQITWRYAFVNISHRVIFDKVSNPLRVKPNGAPSEIDISQDINLHGIDINGEWILLRTAEPVQKARSGWIRWRKGEEILVGFDY